MSIIFGLDLGQTSDFTALVGAEQTTRADGLNSYAFRYLKRFHRGTPYTAAPDSDKSGVVEFTDDLLSQPLFAGHTLAIDQTGVGRPVVDRFHATGRLNILPITITSGNQASPAPPEHGYGWHVPKKLLVSTVQVLLQSRRLTIADKIPEAEVLVKELQNFKVKITTAANEQFGCFTAGTMIETREGEKPIESVQQDDDVLTRNGYNRVLWSGITKRIGELCRVVFDNGSILEGTPDHLVWTQNRGWVELARLTCQDLCIPTPKLFSSTESNIAVRQVPRTSSTAVPKTRCIARFGNSTTARSPMGTTFIIPTRTLATTTSPTWNVSRMPNTPTSTFRDALPNRVNVRPAAPLFLLVVNENQMLPTHASDSVRSAARCLDVSHAPLFAWNASDHSRQMDMGGTARPFAFAPRHAEKPTAIGTEVCQLSPARDAETPSYRSTKFQNTVRVAALPVIVSSKQRVPVYDLVVENDHEFFANGILVHNSWREGDHDDLVLAVAMACWVGENVVVGAFEVPYDRDAQSLIGQAPPGVFYGDPRGEGRDEFGGRRDEGESVWPW